MIFGDLDFYQVFIFYRNMFLSCAKDCKDEKDWQELGYPSALAAEHIQCILEEFGKAEYQT